MVSVRPALQPLAVVVQQRVVGPGDGRARGQQDQRVEQRQVERVENLGALGRPHAAGEGDAAVLDGLVGEQRGVEERPEPGDEEHHLGGDEQDHAVAVADLHHPRMVAGLRFVDDVEPPRRHDVENAGDADAQQRQTEPAERHLLGVHRQDQADGGEEGEGGADQRPRARIDQVVVVMRLGVRVGHSLPLLLPTGVAAAGLDPTGRLRAHVPHNRGAAPPACGASATGLAASFAANNV